MLASKFIIRVHDITISTQPPLTQLHWSFWLYHTFYFILQVSASVCPLLLFGTSCWSRDGCDRLSRHALSTASAYVIAVMPLLLLWWQTTSQVNIGWSRLEKGAAGLDLKGKPAPVWDDGVFVLENSQSCVVWKEAVNTWGEESLRENRSGNTTRAWGQRAESGACVVQLVGVEDVGTHCGGKVRVPSASYIFQ